MQCKCVAEEIVTLMITGMGIRKQEKEKKWGGERTGASYILQSLDPRDPLLPTSAYLSISHLSINSIID